MQKDYSVGSKTNRQELWRLEARKVFPVGNRLRRQLSYASFLVVDLNPVISNHFGASLDDRLGTVEGLVCLAAALLNLNSIFLVGTPCNSSGSHGISLPAES